MIELRSATQLTNAIARAKASHLFVRPTTIYRQYEVANRANGNTYTVNFFVRAGRRFAVCTCQAGLNHQACKHVAAAAALHIYMAAQRIVALPQVAVEPVARKTAPRRETFRGLPL